MNPTIYTVRNWAGGQGKFNLALIDTTSFHWQRQKKTCSKQLPCYVSWSDCQDSYCCSFVMESKCTFFKLVGGICDYDKRYLSGDTVPLSWCDRSIGEYVRSVEISDISSVVELILASASTFSFPSLVSTWTVCPAHRSSLGIGWRRGANRCRVPAGLAEHTNKRKADRGIGKKESVTRW